MGLKCPHCLAKPFSIKLDSNTKFLIEKKSEKEKINKVLHTKEGLGNISESDEEEEKDKDKDKNTPNSKNKDKEVHYLSPLDVIISIITGLIE